MSTSDDAMDERAMDARVVRTRHDVLNAALRVLLDEGWEAVTQPYLARVSGYSRATIYKHWPTRALLLQEAFTHLADMPHHTPTGDLRFDLIAELTAFRTAMAEHRLDRALAVLIDLTAFSPEMRGPCGTRWSATASRSSAGCWQRCCAGRSWSPPRSCSAAPSCTPH